METENMPNTPQEQPLQEAPKKKHHLGLILLLVVLILAVAGGAVYYFTERQKPEETVDLFLESVRKMDFTSMENMLQSKDLSALDNADVRNATYEAFFKEINSKMTYNIYKNSFDIQNGTARITVHIKYIDGSDIYKETISEFLRQVVSTAFSGEELTEEETQQKLASILSEKARSLEDKFSETDIVYPVTSGRLWLLTRKQ